VGFTGFFFDFVMYFFIAAVAEETFVWIGFSAIEAF
jgi:hypothetical protein